MKTAGLVLFSAMILAFASARAFAADAVSVEARLSAAQVYEGDSVPYSVRVKNAKDGERPDISGLKNDFDVVDLGQSRESNSFTVIIQGQTVTNGDETVVFNYQLIPKRQGTLTIPAPFIVTADGRKIVGNEKTIQVIAAEKQDFVLMEIKPSKERPLPKEPFEIGIKIWVKPMPNEDREQVTITSPGAYNVDPPRFQFTWMDPPLGLKTRESLGDWLAKFSLPENRSGFMITYKGSYALLDLPKTREKRTGLDGHEYNYFVYELKRTFIAERPGTYTFGPATIKGQFVNGVAAGGGYTATSVFAVAPQTSVKVETKQAPPANFNGGFGPYQLRASTTGTEWHVGDPMTLTLEFESFPGSSLLEDLTPPDLTANPKLAEDFTVVDKAPLGLSKGNVKSFAYVLRPKKAGVSIPPVTVSIYNIQSEKYEEIASNPVELHVIESPQFNSEAVVSAVPINNRHVIGEREKGVNQNIVDPAEINRRMLRPAAYVAGVAGMWLIYAAALTVLTIQRRRAGDAMLQRRIRAQNETSAQLAIAREALLAQDGSSAGRAVHRALTGLIGILSGSAPEGMTSREAALVLEKTPATKESRIEAARLLDAIEEAKFGSMAGLQAMKLVEDAERLIPVLQREMAGETNL